METIKVILLSTAIVGLIVAVLTVFLALVVEGMQTTDEDTHED